MSEYKKISALSKTDKQYIEDRINKLSQKVLSYNTIDITNDDLRMLFVKCQHQELVKMAATELGLRSHNRFTFSMDDINIVVANQNNDSWVYPKYIGKENFPCAAPEAYAKIERWLKGRIEIGTEFGILMGVFNYLNRTCGNPRTMRYLWPALLGVCRPELADRVRDLKPPKELPAIPSEMVNALKQTEITIAKAMMLPSENPNPPEGGICFYITGYSGRNIELPWGGAGWMI